MRPQSKTRTRARLHRNTNGHNTRRRAFFSFCNTAEERVTRGLLKGYRWAQVIQVNKQIALDWRLSKSYSDSGPQGSVHWGTAPKTARRWHTSLCWPPAGSGKSAAPSAGLSKLPQLAPERSCQFSSTGEACRLPQSCWRTAQTRRDV